jgi:hypothetical protein
MLIPRAGFVPNSKAIQSVGTPIEFEHGKNCLLYLCDGSLDIEPWGGSILPWSEGRQPIFRASLMRP